MIRSDWRRPPAIVMACVLPVAVCLADGVETHLERAQVVASQRLRAETIGTLRPASLSADGRLIAFDSRDGEPSEPYSRQTVHVLDRSQGLLTRETIGSGALQPESDSRYPSLSSDGEVIAFETVANAPADDARSGRPQVVVRTRRNGMVRSPHGTRGEEPDGDSRQPIITGNGLALVFESNAQNLVPGSDANREQADIYQWRLDDSTITRISVDTNGVQPSMGASFSPSVSHDGRSVAFVSTARLAPADSNSVADVYLRDVNRGITLVSKGIGSRPADGPSYSPTLSPNGRYVVFVSDAGNLVPVDRNEQADVYLYDVSVGTITLVSATSTGAAANAASRRPAISGDGRYVVYESVASDLGSAPGCPRAASDTNLLPDIYLLDRGTLCVTRISGSAHREWWTPSVAPAIDASGTLVVFSSTQPANDDDLSTDFDLFFLAR